MKNKALFVHGFRCIGVTGALFAAVTSALAQAPLPTAEELWRVVQAQQAQIDALKARLDAAERQNQAAEQKLAKVDAKVEATSEYVERMPAAGGAAAAVSPTSFGGYGEMHLNFGNTETIDFHRWVLMVQHRFSDKMRFVSEVELEHSIAGESKKGEIELEQAYVEYDFSPHTRLKGGVFLLPLAQLNEIHEPGTYFGVERNRVESELIPTTWWEGGLGLVQQWDNGFTLDLAAHSGLSVPTSGSNAYRLRSGRQKVAEAPASDPAFSGRLKYTGIAGLELGLSGQYQTDMTQSTQSEQVRGVLVAAHADWRWHGLGLRALWGRWDLSGSGPKAIRADEKYGYFLEPSYRFKTSIGEFGLFSRYSRYDAKAGDSASSADDYYDFGLNYWPHPRVVLKVDFQVTNLANSANDDEILNFGLGYQF